MSLMSRRLDYLAAQVAQQRAWIQACGGDLAGYIARYGDSDAPYGKPVSEGGRYGEGGQRIFEADAEALRQVEEQYRAALAHSGADHQLGLWSACD